MPDKEALLEGEDSGLVVEPATETASDSEFGVEPAAGGETGVDDAAGFDESADGSLPGDAPSWVAPRLAEMAEAKRKAEAERAEAMGRVQAFEELARDPDLAPVLQQAWYRKQYGEPATTATDAAKATTEDAYQSVTLPEGVTWDDLLPETQGAYMLLEQQNRRQWELDQQNKKLSEQLQKREQETESQAARDAEQQLGAMIAGFDTSYGIKLPKEQYREVALLAIKRAEVEQLLGRAPDENAILKKAYIEVVQPQLSILKKTASAAAVVSGSRPGNVAGATAKTSGDRRMTAEEAFDDAMRRAFPNGPPWPDIT